MNRTILDYMFHLRAGRLPSLLINTPLQRGAGDGDRVEAVLTVSTEWGKPFKRFSRRPADRTALKRGVNEMYREIPGVERIPNSVAADVSRRKLKEWRGHMLPAASN